MRPMVPISDDRLDIVIQDAVRLVAEVRRLRALVERLHGQAKGLPGLRDSPLLAEIEGAIGTWRVGKTSP